MTCLRRKKTYKYRRDSRLRRCITGRTEQKKKGKECLLLREEERSKGIRPAFSFDWFSVLK